MQSGMRALMNLLITALAFIGVYAVTVRMTGLFVAVTVAGALLYFGVMRSQRRK